MIQLSPLIDPGFVLRGLNNPANIQPTDATRVSFVSEASLDAAIGATVAAKDKPYLTMNDKLFAARYAIGGIFIPPSVQEASVEEEDEDEPEDEEDEPEDEDEDED